MSVKRTDYIILGYKLPGTFAKENGFEFGDDPKFDPYYHGSPKTNFRIVEDQMSGKYTAFGHLIERADEYEGFIFHVIEPRMWSSDMAESVKQKFTELFGLPAPGEPQLLVFTHWR